MPGTIVPLGDLVYQDGTRWQFRTCYHASWGRLLSRTRPTPGNHEYRTNEAGPYYEYFGDAVWGSYLAQPLDRITELGRAQRMATGRGVTVAVIDTGIANHPTLESNLVTGYDFLRDEPLEGEDDLPVPEPGKPDVQQGTTVVLNHLERPPGGGYWGCG